MLCIEQKEIKLEEISNDNSSNEPIPINIQPIKPKFGQLNVTPKPVLKNEEKQDLTEYSTQDNSKFLSAGNETQDSATKIKVQQFHQKRNLVKIFF